MQVSQLGFDITIPDTKAFGGAAFMEAPALKRIADALIEKHEDVLKVVGNFKVRYLWKARGGSQYGLPHYGNCEKPGGLAQYGLGTDFVIWLAADHLFTTGFMAEQIEALMFRQLCGISQNDNTKSAELRGPDFHGYRVEIERYGFWDEPLKALGKALAVQPTLFEGLEADAEEWSNTGPAKDGDGNEIPEGPPVDTSHHPYSASDAETEANLAAAQASASTRGRRGNLAAVN
jgi:hypothetical protein